MSANVKAAIARREAAKRPKPAPKKETPPKVEGE
jgi:hypothetical protein